MDIRPFVQAVETADNVCFIDNRVEVYWGGFNSIIATMELLRNIVDSAVYYDRIVLLQGKDYPLRSPEFLHSFFRDRYNEEFCKAKNITVSPDPRDYMKCCGYWIQDGRKTFAKKLLRKFLAVLNVKLRVKYRRGYFNYDGQRWDVHKGWAQVAITQSCAKYVLDIYENCPQYNDYMRHRFPPDEIYIHTIIYNSHFKDYISEYSLIPRENAEWKSEQLNLTYFEYPINVTVFTDSQDYDALVGTNAMFVRKVTYNESADLLDEIDRHIC